MADLEVIAGAKFYIGGVLASKNSDFIASDFTSQTWVEVDGWVNLGGYGDTSEAINTILINRGRVAKQKGTADAGDMSNTFAVIPGDAGQAAMKAAQKVKSNYAFKVEYDDAPPSGTPSSDLFIGLVMSAPFPGGEANTVKTIEATIGINSNIVEVAAAA